MKKTILLTTLTLTLATSLFAQPNMQTGDGAKENFPKDSKGKELFKQKCVACHILGKPIEMGKLVAPPLNGIMRHLKMNYRDKDKAVAFIKDYAINPSPSKAICMPKKIKHFGLMPSQKGAVTPKELEKIATWMFDNYPKKGFHGMGHGHGMNR